MNEASSVRISKIAVKKDKMGQKWATIQLLRAVMDPDYYEGNLRDALNHMQEHPTVRQMKIEEILHSKNLIFFAAPGMDKASDALHGVEIGSFVIRREEPSDLDWLVLTYEFTIPLEDARRWLIPSVGDDILCVVEDCQLSLE